MATLNSKWSSAHGSPRNPIRSFYFLQLVCAFSIKMSKLLASHCLVVLPLFLGFATARASGRPNASRSHATPPSYVFSIVWTAVYLVLGGVLYSAARSRHRLAPLALALVCAHLAGAFAWTPLYVSQRRREALYVVLGMLATLLALVGVLALMQEGWLAAMVAPYAAWLVFAMMLNFDEVAEQQRGQIADDRGRLPPSEFKRWYDRAPAVSETRRAAFLRQ